MHVSVIRPRELGAAEIAAWRGMQAALPHLGNPFMSPEYAQAVDRVRDGARVAVLTDAGETVGFFPYEQGPMGTGAAIGGWLSLCQGLVHVPGLELDGRELLRACGLHAWEFGLLTQDQPWFEPYAVKHLDSAVMDLSGGFDGYTEGLKAKGSKVVKQTRYKERKLGREVGEVTFSFDVTDPESLRLVREWKSAQYRAMGRADRFARPWVVELTERLYRTRAEGFAGSLSMLYAGGRPVAGHFGLRSDTVLITWFPVYDPDFSRYSPGLALHLRMAEEAAALGVRSMDLGPDVGWRYKQELQNRTIPVAEGVVRRRSPGGAAHWLRRAPAGRARELVLGNKTLYGLADRTMRGYGRIRSRA